MADATTDRSWTPMLVAERLAEAADVLARLPERATRVGTTACGSGSIGALRSSARPAAAGTRGDRPHGRGARLAVLA